MFKQKIFFILFLLALSGCSPFGNESLITSAGKKITQLLPGIFSPTKVELNSGGSKVVQISNPMTPSQIYTVSLSVGSSYNQQNTVTVGNYKVYSSIQATSE